VPLRGRILAAARNLFYREGIHSVSVDTIAEAAGTNKMSVYRNFPSKENLIVAYLEELAAEGDALWEEVRAAHPGDAEARLRLLLERISQLAAEPQGRGCALANAAVELAARDHPARRVIEAHKRSIRLKLVALCREAGYLNAEHLADEIFLLCEGARVSVQSVGRGGPSSRLHALADALLDAAPRRARRK
jgi:AcrR family transcriptional regulator